jgi:hypothetical protein
MFGYVRPLKGELKVSELEAFRAVYCGLCHTLGRRYGLPARFVLNYDLAFFSAILYGVEGDMCFERRRCIASPFRRKCMACRSPASELAADLTVLLTFHKLDDEVRDRRGIRRLAAFALRLLMHPFYRRARRLRPGLSEKIGRSLEELSRLEKELSPSIDRTADAFAGILAGAAEEAAVDKKMRRILGTMFYHIGRWIYIVDACDDFGTDQKNLSYNPIAYRYGLREAGDIVTTLPADIKEEIKTTLTYSLAAAASAFELLEFERFKGLVANVIYHGLYAVTSAVLDGTWQRRRKTDERPL